MSMRRLSVAAVVLVGGPLFMMYKLGEKIILEGKLTSEQTIELLDKSKEELRTSFMTRKDEELKKIRMMFIGRS